MSYRRTCIASVSRMAARCAFIVALGTSVATSSVCAQQQPSPVVPAPAPASTSAVVSGEPIIAPIRRVQPGKAAVEAKQKAKQAATAGAAKVPTARAAAKTVPITTTEPAAAAAGAGKSAKTGVVVYGPGGAAKVPAKAATSSR